MRSQIELESFLVYMNKYILKVGNLTNRHSPLQRTPVCLFTTYAKFSCNRAEIIAIRVRSTILLSYLVVVTKKNKFTIVFNSKTVKYRQNEKNLGILK